MTSERRSLDLGPLVGKKRGLRMRERILFSGGMRGMEMGVAPSSKEGQEERHGRPCVNGRLKPNVVFGFNGRQTPATGYIVLGVADPYAHEPKFTREGEKYRAKTSN